MNVQANAEQLAAKLRNLDVTWARRLLRIGIDDHKALACWGAKAVYVRIWNLYKEEMGLDVRDLYRLKGAILDCAPDEIPYYKKQEYRQFLRYLAEKEEMFNVSIF